VEPAVRRPEHGAYTDHLAPIVLLALNTGLRRGELFNLRWADVDLTRAMVTVQGGGAKSGQTRHVPLNSEALAVIKAWRPTDADAATCVFPSDEGAPLEDVKTAWLPLVKAAKITAFRFHDLRHTFASKLVMAGVDLNTVRELLGHADLKMTLRYAHLAPEHKAAAVAKLVRA
jgi:integrase